MRTRRTQSPGYHRTTTGHSLGDKLSRNGCRDGTRICSWKLSKGLRRLRKALQDEPSGDEEPESIANDIVGPVVYPLRTAQDNAVDHLLECARTVVQDKPVELTHTDDGLQRVPEVVRGCNVVCGKK